MKKKKQKYRKTKKSIHTLFYNHSKNIGQSLLKFPSHKNEFYRSNRNTLQGEKSVIVYIDNNNNYY